LAKSSSASAFSLHGKMALIVGGSSGIGQAVAHGFQANGARVAIAAEHLQSSKGPPDACSRTILVPKAMRLTFLNLTRSIAFSHPS
jgi:NAD(P)-dependent dehydrogenase (short-subunit alcohol dehydrogenase family)